MASQKRSKEPADVLAAILSIWCTHGVDPRACPRCVLDALGATVCRGRCACRNFPCGSFAGHEGPHTCDRGF